MRSRKCQKSKNVLYFVECCVYFYIKVLCNFSSVDEQENKSWYHYEDTPENDLIQRLRNDEDEEAVEDVEEEDENSELVSLCQLEPQVKELLRDSWLQLQKR